jgi:saxitoxin biosynthesis operon SxtJ-like protein
MEDTPRLPSERSFGLLFAAVSAGFGAWSLYAGRSALGGTLLVAAIVFLLLALAAPRLLAWPNRLWFRLGMALNAVVSPIVLFVMFALMFVPVALVMRAAGRDPLKRRYETAAATYWIDRRPPGPPPDSFKQQF